MLGHYTTAPTPTFTRVPSEISKRSPLMSNAIGWGLEVGAGFVKNQ